MSFGAARKNIADVAAAAFPFALRAQALDAAEALSPYFLGLSDNASIHVLIGSEKIVIPYRLHFTNLDATEWQARLGASPLCQCLGSRATDGYVRQAALQSILAIDQPWSVPFVVALAGEYVREIAEDIYAARGHLHRDIYVDFVRENRALTRRLRERAISYWNCYHRSVYPDLRTYPDSAFLRELERWSA